MKLIHTLEDRIEELKAQIQKELSYKKQFRNKERISRNRVVIKRLRSWIEDLLEKFGSCHFLPVINSDSECKSGSPQEPIYIGFDYGAMVDESAIVGLNPKHKPEYIQRLLSEDDRPKTLFEQLYAGNWKPESEEQNLKRRELAKPFSDKVISNFKDKGYLAWFPEQFYGKWKLSAEYPQIKKALKIIDKIIFPPEVHDWKINKTFEVYGPDGDLLHVLKDA